jgi:thiol:disulfide interchange protein
VLRGFYLKNCAFDFNGTWEQFFKQVTAPMLWRFPVWILVMLGAAFTTRARALPLCVKLLRFILSLLQEGLQRRSRGYSFSSWACTRLVRWATAKPMEEFMREALPQRA